MSNSPFYPSELRQIDKLVRAALMQPSIRERLIRHDENLCDEFQIAPHTWSRLVSIHADTLQEFCYQILHIQDED